MPRATRKSGPDSSQGQRQRRRDAQQSDLLSWMFGCGSLGSSMMERSGSHLGSDSRADGGSSRSSSSDSRGSFQQPGCLWVRQGCLLDVVGDEDFQNFGRWCTGNSAPPARFHLIPRTGWDPHVQKLKCSARNVLAPDDTGHIPEAPEDCWLLPSSDAMAVTIATHRKALRGMGWKVLSCEPAAVKRLGNKSALQTTARALGLSGSLPRAYASSKTAEYPCILKAAVGQHGKDVYIVESAEEVDEIAPHGMGNQWVLQELVHGPMEYSVSMLVSEGSILDAICTEYEYAKDVYIWPEVEEIGRHSHDEIPKQHLQVMEKFLHEYSGICNFNYKVRPTGEMCIFEVNTRIGADLACDVPRRRARKLFEMLDERCTRAVRLGLMERRFSSTAAAPGKESEGRERPLISRNAGNPTGPCNHPNLLSGSAVKSIPGAVSTSAPGSPAAAGQRPCYSSPFYFGSTQVASPTASPVNQAQQTRQQQQRLGYPQHHHPGQLQSQPQPQPQPQPQSQSQRQTGQRTNFAASLASPTAASKASAAAAAVVVQSLSSAGGSGVQSQVKAHAHAQAQAHIQKRALLVASPTVAA